MTDRLYDLFGLTIASAFEIAWAPEARAVGAADVIVRRASLPAEAPAEASNVLQFAVPGVARYRISRGVEIAIDPDEGADEESIRLYLLGSALGVLLHQRGLLVLHANAVVIDGEAVLFMGPSGSGKSTLAAWFAARGYPVLTDDICVVAVGAEGQAVVLPGLTRLRLSDQAAEQLAFDTGDASRCPSSGKREIGLPSLDPGRPAKLGACYLLTEAHDRTHVRALKAVDAVEMLMANTYRGAALHQLGGNAGHLQSCVRIAGRVPCFEVRRVKAWERFDQIAESLVAHARTGVLAA